MTKMRTKKVVTQEIAKLKELMALSVIPHYTRFGDDNWEGVRAQLEVLEGKLTYDQMMERLGSDPDEEEFTEDWPEHTHNMAVCAWDWYTCQTDERPSDGWGK